MENEAYFVFIYTDGKDKIYQMKYLSHLYYSRLKKKNGLVDEFLLKLQVWNHKAFLHVCILS